jgi:hypothetical protein
MKKLLTILSLVFAGSVYAGSATVEYGMVDNVKSADQNSWSLAVRENINKNFLGDVLVLQVNQDGSNALASTRLEAGATGLLPTKFATLYTRTGVGERYISTGSYGYYSVEPGLTAPLGSSGFIARAGWRFRTPFNTAMNDTTRTWRAGLGYAITKQDTIGVRYDRVQGDADQKTINVNYTRNF